MTSRRLFFKSDNLGDDVALKLFLMPRVATVTTNPSPVLWRETTLGATGSYGLDLTCDAQSIHAGMNNLKMVFFKHQGVLCGQTVSAATWVPIEIGQETTLFEKPTCPTDQGPPTYAFTKPVPREDLLSAVKAVNNTGHPVFLSLGIIGFVTDKGTVDEVIHCFKTWKVEEGDYVQTDPHEPVLRAYVLPKHQEGGCVIGDIGTNELVWEVDVLSLDPKTTINISKDKLTGKFSATKSTISATAQPLPPVPAKPPTSATPDDQGPPEGSIEEQPTENVDVATPPAVNQNTHFQSSGTNTEITPCEEGNNSLFVPGDDKPVIPGERGSANGQSVPESTTTMPVEVGQEIPTGQQEIITIGSAATATHQSRGVVEPRNDGDHKATDGTNQAVSISDTSRPSKETNGATAYGALNGVPGGPNTSDPPKNTSVVANGSD